MSNQDSDYFTKRGLRIYKSLRKIEGQLDNYVGLKVNQDTFAVFLSRLMAIKQKVEILRAQFKKKALDLVTPNIKNEQNIVYTNIITGAGKKVNYTPIFEMDETLKELRKLKNSSSMGFLKTKLEELENIKKSGFLQQKKGNNRKTNYDKENTWTTSKQRKRPWMYKRFGIIKKINKLEEFIREKNKQDKVGKTTENKITTDLNEIQNDILKIKQDFSKQIVKLINQIYYIYKNSNGLNKNNVKSNIIRNLTNTGFNSNALDIGLLRTTFNYEKTPPIRKLDKIITKLKEFKKKVSSNNNNSNFDPNDYSSEDDENITSLNNENTKNNRASLSVSGSGPQSINSNAPSISIERYLRNQLGLVDPNTRTNITGSRASSVPGSGINSRASSVPESGINSRASSVTGSGRTGSRAPSVAGSGRTGSRAPSVAGSGRTGSRAPSVAGSGRTGSRASSVAGSGSNSRAPSVAGSGRNSRAPSVPGSGINSRASSMANSNTIYNLNYLNRMEMENLRAPSNAGSQRNLNLELNALEEEINRRNRHLFRRPLSNARSA